jgi:hypothetical protein
MIPGIISDMAKNRKHKCDNAECGCWRLHVNKTYSEVRYPEIEFL